MQKILTGDEKERKARKNQIITGSILITLMIFSTAGFAFSEGREKDIEKIEHKGVEFIRDDSGYWYFNARGFDFYTQYNPKEVEDIHFLNLVTIQQYQNKPLYFVGNYPEPISEISRNMNYFVLRYNEACLEGINCSENAPVKNCSNDNVIIIQESEEEEIFKDENCIFIKSTLQNQTKYADAYLFSLLGIN